MKGLGLCPCSCGDATADADTFGIWARAIGRVLPQDNPAPGERDWFDAPFIAQSTLGVSSNGLGTFTPTSRMDYQTKGLRLTTEHTPQNPFVVQFDSQYTHWQTTPASVFSLVMFGRWAYGYRFADVGGFFRAGDLFTPYIDSHCLPTMAQCDIGTVNIPLTFSGGWNYAQSPDIGGHGAVVSGANIGTITRQNLQAADITAHIWMDALIVAGLPIVNPGEFFLQPSGTQSFGGTTNYAHFAIDNLQIDSDFRPQVETWEIDGPGLVSLGLTQGPYRFTVRGRYSCGPEVIDDIAPTGAGFTSPVTAEMSWQNETPEIRITREPLVFGGQTQFNFRAVAWAPDTDTAEFTPNFGSNELGFEKTRREQVFNQSPSSLGSVTAVKVLA